MKNKSIILRAIVFAVAVVAVICTVSLTRDLIKKHRIATRKPLLRMETKVPNFWTLIGPKKYYIIYDNGDYEKTEEFTALNTEVYHLYLYDEDRPDNIEKPEYVPTYIDNVIKIVNDMGKGYLGEDLFITEERYFFSVYYDHDRFLYEYLPESNKAKQITKIPSQDIKNIELY